MLLLTFSCSALLVERFPALLIGFKHALLLGFSLVVDADVLNVWQARSDDYSIVHCAMLYGLKPGLQRLFERHRAYEMFQELKLIFQANAQVERYEVSNKFYSCKMEENSTFSEHILKISGYYNHLTRLGVDLSVDCVIERVL